MMKVNLALYCVLVALFLLSLGHAQLFHFAEFHAKTAESVYAEMNFGSFDAEIITGDFQICYMYKLKKNNGSFAQGQIDIFLHDELQECKNIILADKFIGKLRIYKHGFDNWTPEWFKIVYSDGTYAQCDDGVMMNTGDEHDLQCELQDVNITSTWL